MELTGNIGDHISPGRRRLCMIEKERSGAETSNCIKRRRRDRSTFALSCNNQQICQQQQRPLGDSTAALATT